MKTKMKTKMKTIISICAISILLYSCSKDTPTLDPVLDCMGIENGLAVLDDCGTCHQSYIYDVVSHIPTYINDTAGLALTPTQILVIAGSAADIASNPNWDAACK